MRRYPTIKERINDATFRSHGGYLRTDQVMKILGISESMVRILIKQGYLRCSQRKKRCVKRISLDSVVAQIREFFKED
jgi:hypothetical protein